MCKYLKNVRGKTKYYFLFKTDKGKLVHYYTTKLLILDDILLKKKL